MKKYLLNILRKLMAFLKAIKRLFSKKNLLRFLVFILLLLCLLYQVDSVYVLFRNKVNTRIVNYTGVDLLSGVDEIANALDIVGGIKAIQKPVEESDYIDLYFSDSSKRNLDKYLTISPVKKKWVKAEIDIDDKKYQCKIKYHGTDDAHYINGKYSYTIKLKNITGYYQNAKRYKLIKGEEAEPTIFAANHLAHEMGLIAPVGSMKMLRINGAEVGHYYFTEDVKKGYLERKFGISNYAVLANVSDWTRKERAVLGTPHISDLDLYKEHVESDDALLHSKGIEVYGTLCELITEHNVDELVKYFDAEYMGKFMALASLFNDVHFITGDNLKLIYDFNRGKFYPVYRAEHAWRPLNNEVVISEGRTINKYPDYNKILFESFPLYRASMNTNLFKLLLSNNKVREARDKVLFKLVSNKNNIIHSVSKTHSENERVMLNADVCRKPYRIKKNDQINFVSSMLRMSSQYLHYNHVYGSYDSLGNKLTVVNDGFCNVKIVRKSDLIDVGVAPGIGMSSNLDFQYGRSNFAIVDTIFNAKNYYFINTVTKDTISKKHIHFNFIDKSGVIKAKNTLEMLNTNNIDFVLDSNTLMIKTGNYSVCSDIIFSDNYSVVIEKGVEFSISSGKTVLFHSNLSVNGTEESPVIVRKKDTTAYGTFAIVGGHCTPIVEIDYLQVSGGGEAYLQGLLFTGQFAIYNANVSINNSSFVHSSGDDGLNLKYCKAKLNNCSFEYNKADQVDLDFCWAKVESCSFSPSQLDPNGDGLDVSGSHASVSHCKFQGFVDKGVSVGENSTICLLSNSFYNNRSAITIKDQSEAYAWENKFSNNEFDYSLFIKKMIFNKPVLFMEKASREYIIDNITGEVKELEKNDLGLIYEAFLESYEKYNSEGALTKLAQ